MNNFTDLPHNWHLIKDLFKVRTTELKAYCKLQIILKKQFSLSTKKRTLVLILKKNSFKEMPYFVYSTTKLLSSECTVKNFLLNIKVWMSKQKILTACKQTKKEHFWNILNLQMIKEY